MFFIKITGASPLREGWGGGNVVFSNVCFGVEGTTA